MAEKEVNALLANMFAMGLLDDQFQELLMLQDANDPDFIAQVVTLFYEEGERIIGELAELLDTPDVDFDKVDAFARDLKENSLCIGAQSLKNTCMQFREFCEQKSRDGCLLTLYALRTDFYDLCSKFQTMLQLQQQV